MNRAIAAYRKSPSKSASKPNTHARIGSGGRFNALAAKLRARGAVRKGR
jgi:hypothetical protein